MPVYDFECTKCGLIKEFILKISESERLQDCPDCSAWMTKIISASGQYCGNEDTGWLKSIPEVVDPTTGRAAAECFKNPTRANYKRWMKESGIRPMESNEQMKPDPVNLDKVNDEVQRRHHERLQDSEYRRRSERIMKHGHHN